MSEANKASEKLNDTMNVERMPVKPMPFTQPYWDATKDKKVLIQYDPETGKYQHFPHPGSMFTGKRNLEWREVSGKGEVYSFTITRRAPPPFRGHEPFAIAMVTLDEGVRVMGNLVNVAPEDIKVGMKVVPTWAPLNDGYHHLMFQPA